MSLKLSLQDRRQKSSVALVMTLLCLAVITVLLLAFFESATHQIRSAQNEVALAREKILADNAVQLVIGQIEKASTQTNQAWISQPGLLRTYSTNAVRTPTACYKLYSTATTAALTDTSGTVSFFATDVPNDWATHPDQYVDLNAPAQMPGFFSSAIYPILDPNALTNAANLAAGTQIAGLSSDSGAVTMPVAWLYQLQDGTLGPASNGTAANPIVARIAFWTDDDSSKININTAGCGSPWNTPRFNTTNDTAWSSNQPAAGEYSAYPGHPATTSLAVVFGTNSPQQLLGLTPRYGWGGSQFGTLTTTVGEIVPAKTDRLYASLDELCFGTSFDGNGERLANSVTPAQVERARVVLTAHSVSPETTLLGEPRIAIWPVADSTSTTSPRITAMDAAITNAATIGIGTGNARSYFFQRNNPLATNDDFDPTATHSAPTTSNLQLFNDLVTTRGTAILPGYGAAFTTKYSGATWPQLMLEIVDFIRGINAVDPTPAPFVPFAGGDSAQLGYGFVEPLTTTYGSGTTAVGLRGLGRCPTLSSLTLVFYVSGFNFSNGTHIDFEETPDDASGTIWRANLLPSSTNWTSNLLGERIRAFVVPTTFQPGCAYPEVSDNCSVQITGMHGLSMTATSTNDLGFATNLVSQPLSDAQKITPVERAWGGNEGPIAWRAAALQAQTNSAFTNFFEGSKPYSVTLTAAQKPTYNSGTGVLTWPSNRPSLSIAKAISVTALIRDTNGNPLQTLNLTFPITGGIPVPLPVAEFTRDSSTNTVFPSTYMTLRNRVLLTGMNREFMIQPNDASRSVEAATDLRVIAGLTNAPATLFKPHPSYSLNGALHAHNLHFADGESVFGATNANILVGLAAYPAATTNVAWTEWTKNITTNYTWPISARCSAPTTNTTGGVTMLPTQNIAGDWDTGPGLSPDGAQINLPDAGTTNDPGSAYFSLTSGSPGAPTRRTPNALVPSPVIFGSLPAGINPAAPGSSTPWRTLLFCPYPASSTSATPYSGHPGAATPPDHLILDNFWMPVVEPYPISTCMATSGKINLNDQITPFTYLHRNTALRALLDDLRIPAVPTSAASSYKAPGTAVNVNYWNAVDEDDTVAQIENRFTGSSADAYLSESEICTVPLVPKLNPTIFSTDVSATRTALLSFWNNNAGAGRLTGDNLRELPYAQLYSRLTTRSNSYTVHVRVQVLKKLPADSHQDVWNEGVDVVQGDWRGSYEIERYLDPAAPAPAAGSMLGPYKFRILSARRFAP